MNKKVVKLKILIPMLAITLLCGVSVLVTSIFAYSDKVNSVIYERIENSKEAIMFRFSTVMENTRLAAIEFAERPDFIEAFQEGDFDAVAAMAGTLKSREQLDFGLFTDNQGNVLLRTHDRNNINGNVAQAPQMQLLLEGETDASITRGEQEALRLSAGTAIYNEDDEIIGTVTFGRNLDNRNFAYSLREMTGNDVTIFDGQTNIASSLNWPSLSFLAQNFRDDIISTVIDKGTVYEGELNFLEMKVLAKIFPLYGTDGNIVGMILVGVHTSVATGEIFSFILSGSIITLIVFIIAIFVSFYVSGNIEKQFGKMITDMTHRDKLLEAVNQASAILLEIDETDDIRAPLISGMELIGNAMSVDHVHLWQGRTDEEGITQFVREYSWVSNYAKSRSKAPKYIYSSTDSSKLDWMEKFLQGEYIGGVISNMPESYQELLKPLNTKSITMVPLFLENQFWGMFSIDNINKELVFADEEVTILRSISLMMANIVRRHALQNENLKVYFDALTGIHNRRFFDKTMRRVISSLSRAGGTLSVMMIDVDYFKKYNDTYGHGAGDECLIKVAEVLSSSVMRVDDFVARYGGEEFVAVMPNTDEAGAVAVAEKMLENIRGANIEHKASEVEKFVTFSIGLTSGVVTQFHTPDSFVAKADEMLYKSKGEGRNRYTFGEIT